MDFNQILKNVRKELNITQEQLAQGLSISFSTVNRWENAKTAPSKLAKLRLIEYCKNCKLSDELMSHLQKL